MKFPEMEFNKNKAVGGAKNEKNISTKNKTRKERTWIYEKNENKSRKKRIKSLIFFILLLNSKKVKKWKKPKC